jgi:hypothetical protein
MTETVDLKKTVPVAAAEEKAPEKGLTEDSSVILNRFRGICN